MTNEEIKKLSKTEIKELIENTDSKSRKEKIILTWISAQSTSTFALSKVTEEAIEVAEVSVKMINKLPASKPPLEDLLSEYADLSVRIMVFLNSVAPTKEEMDKYVGILTNKCSNKVEKIYKYLSE